MISQPPPRAQRKQIHLQALPGNGLDIIRKPPRIPATAHDETSSRPLRIGFKKELQVRGVREASACNMLSSNL